MHHALLLGFFLFSFAVWGAQKPLVSTAMATDPARICFMGQRYAVADSMVQALSLQMPGNQEALYLRCAIRQTRILDYESYTIDGDEFLNLADSALSVLTKTLRYQKGKDSLEALFYIGSILGGKGIILAKKGKWPFAVRCALRSVGYFRQVVALDSTYYAAYYGIGVFNYYLSQNLKWLPFFGDRRAEAIRQIKRSTAAPCPYNFAACNSLCWILIERNELNAADSIVSGILADYPQNTLFLRIKIRVALGLSQWSGAVTAARSLIDLSLQRRPENWADVISGYQALACAYDHLRRDAACREVADKALSLNFPEAYRKIPFVKKHLKYLEEIQKKYGTR
jgi:hypothetical protein